MEDGEHGGLRHVMGVARRQWLLLLLVPLMAGAAGLGVSLLQDKTYEATAILVAGQGGTTVGSVDQVESVNAAAVSLSAMATDRVVLQDALSELNDETTDLEDLVERTTASVPVDSQKIEITVTDGDANRAARYANAIAASFADLVTERKVARLNLSASVWQEAVPPASAASPNVPVNVAAALLVGLVLAGALAAARESLDATWRSERDIESDLGLPVMTMIPEMRAKRARRPEISA